MQWIPGGGGTSICMHIGYVPQTRPPFSAMNFRSGAYHFHKLPKNPFRSISFSQITKKSVPEHITILHFLADFAVPETIIFKISLISTRSSPPTAAAQRVRQRRGLAAVPEIRIFKRSAAPRVSGRSGDSHFQAFGSAAG